jgi:hypothetical protein
VAIVFKQDEENKRKNYKYKKEGRMEELGKRVLLTHFPPASTLFTQLSAQTNKYLVFYTLIKKIIKFSSYIMKFRIEQLQSHAQMRKYFTIYEEAVSHI